MAYGELQGLKEAYESFRSREADIRKEAIQDEELEYMRTQRQREEEEYQYGLSRRPMQERLTQAQVEGAEVGVEVQQLGLEQATDERQEWLDNAEQRKEAARLQRKQLEQQLKNAGQTYNMNEIKLAADKNAQKMREWKLEFMGEMDDDKAIRTLIDRFNSDDEDDNNIKNVTPRTDGGWTVEYENGSAQEFADRGAIERHLEFMADPEFHQNYMLQMSLQQMKLAAAAKDTADANAKTLLTERNRWAGRTIDNTDRQYGKIKEGLVSFGEAGAADVASAVRGIVDTIGGMSQYTLDNSAVADRVARLADTMLIMDPRELRKRAEDIFEELPNSPEYFDPARFPEGKPDKDDPEYQVAIKNLVFKDLDEQVKNLEQAAISQYAMFNEDTGRPVLKEQVDSKGEGGDQITTKGLERPGEPPAETPEALKKPTQADVTPPIEREVGTPTATIKFGPKTLVSQKEKEYGLDTKAIRRGRAAPKSKKRKVQQDFDANFASWDKNSQGAWFRKFGKYLKPEQVAKAKDALGGTQVAEQ